MGLLLMLTVVLFLILALITVNCEVVPLSGAKSWDVPNSEQYHIQTDNGNERYFRYQTYNGQYRREKRLDDGTVVGTYAWIDAAGFLRQRDYIADKGGYRILKTKKLYVGVETPVSIAMRMAKSPTTVLTTVVPPLVNTKDHHQSILNQISSPSTYLVPPSSLAPITYYNNKTVLVPVPGAKRTHWLRTNNDLDTDGTSPYFYKDHKSKFMTFRNGPTYPLDNRGYPYMGSVLFSKTTPPQVTNDGFRYYIPKAYHEEQRLSLSTWPGHNTKAGSFGYIDPFGIRRVIYYKAGPGTGFQHRKNNRYVGHQAAPYDPI